MQEDHLLWKAYLDGDKTSFETIYTRYHRNLYEYGMRKWGDEDLVRDGLQDLFVRLWVNRGRIGPTDNIKYYLIAALRNALINASIQQDKRRAAEVGEEPFELAYPEPGASASGDRQARLVAALDQLTGRQKEVIYLRYFEDLSYEQIASLMDISVKGIYKLHYRALDALKDILGISRQDLLLLLAMCKVIFS
ncbi:RNA polymerase sigma factor (sigma-70 family) [Dinghuibacter silviterrae]|uniref:RNA polymerase sigma factor (Sigma-70 family) n=2 Tax=Dinghuibacter silviterrae TaxID=1539049 RepID=A0A4R8DWI2_9BACT|nr:RNA polymerase sigma factor (sigma-70 family) [Dinghuibacter silviterrae]